MKSSLVLSVLWIQTFETQTTSWRWMEKWIVHNLLNFGADMLPPGTNHFDLIISQDVIASFPKTKIWSNKLVNCINLLQDCFSKRGTFRNSVSFLPLVSYFFPYDNYSSVEFDGEEELKKNLVHLTFNCTCKMYLRTKV